MIKTSFPFWVFFLALLTGIDAFPQKLPFHNYTMKDGLISYNIHAQCQDSLGFIWIGTGEGISVFDSKEFRNYSVEDGMPEDNIISLAADSKNPGEVWIGTRDSGMIKYRNGIFIRIKQARGKSYGGVSTIHQTPDNTVWCGTDSGLAIVKNDSIYTLSVAAELGSINAITSDNHGFIWIASDNGLFKLSPDKKISKVQLVHSVGQPILTLFTKTGNTIWIGTGNGWIYKVAKGKVLPVTSDINSTIKNFTEDNSGMLWVSTSNGIFKIDKGYGDKNSYEWFSTKNGLLEKNIAVLFFDKENILWVGDNDFGLQKLVYLNLIKFSIDTKHFLGDWSSTAADKNNHFWISFNDGLLEVWKDGRNVWRKYFHKQNYFTPQDYLQPISIDKKNNLFVARFSGKITAYHILNNSLSGNHQSELLPIYETNLAEKYNFYRIYTTYADARGNLWCSALDIGIIVLSPSGKILKNYTYKDGLPANSIRAIYQDKKGNLWFGGYADGLSEFSKDKVMNDLTPHYPGSNIFVKHYDKTNGLSDDEIRSINEDDLGNILVGTRYGGLNIIRSDSIQTINKSRGLFSNAIWSIISTPSGNIWLGTQSGVQKLDRDLHPTLDLNEEIPKEPYYSISPAANGNLCFINNEEIYFYSPSAGKEIIAPPPVYITHLLINGQEHSITQNPELGSDQNTITFEFIGIINREQSGTSYMYRLLKSDKKWSLLTNRNSITYASLEPGKYRFQVLAVNSEGLKSTQPAELSFTINAPFYEQWWFITAIFALIVTSIAAFLRIRIKRMLEIEKIRTRIAADLHDEIGSGLTRIAILSESALQEDEPGNISHIDEKTKYTRQNSIKLVGKISRSLVDSMIDVIWSIDPKYDSLPDFVFNFKNYAYAVCEAKNINLKIETSDIEKVKVNSQIKRSLQLMTKEVLNNSLKYSGCKNIRFSLSAKNKTLYLVIEDDGDGFDPETVSRGRGLFNIEKHVTELSGKLEIFSSFGKGTKVKINFPL